MELRNIILISTIAMCLIASFVWLSFLSKSETNDGSILKSSFLPIYVLSFVTFLGLYIFFPYNQDFIVDAHWTHIAIPMFCAGLIYFSSYLFKDFEQEEVLIALCCIVSTFCLPLDFVIYSESLPFWLNPIISIIIWFGFSIGLQYLNSIDGLATLQMICITSGICILSIFGGAPTLLGATSGCLLAILLSFLAFNWYPAAIKLSNNACLALGFIIGMLFLQTSSEASFPCVLTFSLYFIVELAWALIKKATRRPQFSNIANNTTYSEANASGLSPNTICRYLSKTMILLVILGCFQLYSPNSYSFPTLAFVIVLWNIARLKNWQEPTQSFKELNKELIKNIKTSVDTIKSSIDKGTDK